MPMMPRGQLAWARAFSRAATLFTLQGVAVLAHYARLGFDAPPASLPLGLQLDPAHGVLHLVLGLAGGLVGFLRPGASLRFVQAFAVVYLALAVLGTFTPFHLGLELQVPENALHWTLGLAAAAIGFRPLRQAPPS